MVLHAVSPECSKPKPEPLFACAQERSVGRANGYLLGAVLHTGGMWHFMGFDGQLCAKAG